MKRVHYIWATPCLLLAAGLVWQYHANRTLSDRVETLQAELTTYRENEGKSHVVERISKQMEDIAYQQKDIAEQQREEAIFQMGVAEQMRLRAEEEQQRAEESARNAAEARNMAEQQREVAVQQQQQAEQARNEADTLSMVALGRALAMLSTTQARAGNADMAKMLAYAAWRYTADYRGDIYQPALIDALRQSGGSTFSRNLHQGGVMQIVRIPDSPNEYASVSDYGEIRRWRAIGEGLTDEQILFSDPAFSFRDAYADPAGIIYALAYDGRLVVVDETNAPQTVALPEPNGWMRVCPFDDTHLLLASSAHLYIYSIPARSISQTLALPRPLAALGFREGQWIVFGKGGGQWALTPDGTLTAQDRWVNEEVTAYAWSDEWQMAAIGTEAGNIYLTDNQGYTQRRLVGHRSRITQLGFRRQHLFSTSYDCTLNLWDVTAARQEAVSLHTFASWARCFTLSAGNALWAGDETGSVTRLMTAPAEMAAKVRARLKRDFTDEEWSFYVGTNVPRRSMLNDK